MRRPTLRAQRRPAFTLPEAAATAAVVALLAAMLLSLGSESRRQASLTDDLANLRALHAAYLSYAADNDDRVATFSWEAGVDYGHGFGPASTPMQAAADQAVHILRTRAGLDDLPRLSAWIPHLRYSHLAMADHLDGRFPTRLVVSPEDRIRLLWQADPFDGFDALSPTERPYPVSPANRRWAFSATYELPPAFCSPDAASPDGIMTIAQDATSDHNLFHAGDAPLGRRRLAEISLPAQKVMLHDSHQRHFGPAALFFGYRAPVAVSRVVSLTADGAAAARSSENANRGFHPNFPERNIDHITYAPAPWEPPTVSGNPADLVRTLYRFTRSGLRGRDFGGPPVPWQD